MPAGRSLYGYELDSAFPLRRLLDRPGPRGRLELRGASGRLARPGGTLVHAWSDGEVTFTLRRAGEALHATCSLTGEFVVDGGAGVVRASPSDGPDERWEHRIVATAVPLLLAERGDVVAHAAAVELDGRAIVFVGPPGRGKSTVAAAAASLGHRILGEDGAAIELTPAGARLWPGPAGIRVRPDVAAAFDLAPDLQGGGKRTHFVRRAQNGDAPVPVGAVAVLGERAASASLARLDPAAAVPCLVPNLIFGGSDRLREAVRGAARLATLAPVYRCILPGDLGALPSALRRLLDALATAAEPVTSGAARARR